MPIKLFITGTDTNVGKTYVSSALLRKFAASGYTALGMKPVASGCDKVNGKLYNADALALQAASSLKLPYDIINPFAFEQPIAPHIAANMAGTELSKKEILKKIRQFFNYPADVYLVEGAGGWHVPLNNTELLSDLVKQLAIPVILVVAIKLGCLNHAILTSSRIKSAKIPLLGWIANCIEPDMLNMAENIATLKNWMDAPCLGILPYGETPETHITLEIT